MALLHASTNRNTGVSRKELNSPLLVDDQAILHKNQAGNTNTTSSTNQDDDEMIHGSNDQISVYVVRQGDSLPQIAQMFGVTVNTIRWANDLGPKEAISKGQQLIILPISGVKYKIKEGDILKRIAEKYNGNTEEIISFNGLDGRSDLTPGEQIIIPNGEIETITPSKATTKTQKSVASKSKSKSSGYFVRPVSGGKKSQGLHGHNGVDIASSLNTAVVAAAGGEVIIAKGGGGWNGGYGNYVVIKHGNGTQTLYGHLNSVKVSQGEKVSQGAVIGGMGNTGQSSGVHLHFEVRGGTNPF